MYAEQCLKEKFIGADFEIHEDLTNKLPENWREFNHRYIPVFLQNNPGKTKIAAGLACGMLWTICKGISIGDIVLSPNGHGRFMVGEVISDYYYKPNDVLFHRRNIQWYPITINRSEVSAELRSSTNSSGTSTMITKHAEEIERFISGSQPLENKIEAENVEDPSIFALEKHLEDFLVHNWQYTELGKKYEIYTEDGEIVGQQYPSDTGPIDILAISKDKKELLVVELKRGKASDAVIGQIQRYMGFIKDERAELGQIVKGVIIALDNDKRIKRALSVTNNIEFYRYQVSFKLFKG